MPETRLANRILAVTTAAFVVCFAAWMLNGVLVTHLVEQGVFDWSSVQAGWLVGAPVLTGSVLRLPAGILTDKYGGKPVMIGVLVFTAFPLGLLSLVTGYWSFLLCSLGFGVAGAGFAVGIAYVAAWYPQKWRGTAMGVFGAGNAGAAITTLVAPTALGSLTDHGANPEGWRTLPLLYAASMLGIAAVFALTTRNRGAGEPRTLTECLQPLKDVRVWRFGLYYFLVFGCFVAFAQWLVPYFVNSYQLSLVTAGLLASAFSFPSGVVRAAGGWMSDVWGARKVMYWVLGLSALVSLLLVFPRMVVETPGEGVLAEFAGTVVEVTEEVIIVDDRPYDLVPHQTAFEITWSDDRALIWPTKQTWQEPVVQAGQPVVRRQLLASGRTQIYFQANIWIAVVLIVLIGVVWGIGKAAVYKYIPEYFPGQVGVVGGMIGVIGGLGGFVCPVIFAYLLEWTGFWTSCWIFMFFVSALCLWWMHHVVSRILDREHGTTRDLEVPVTREKDRT